MKKDLFKLSILAILATTANACDTGEYNEGKCDAASFVSRCINATAAMECGPQGMLVAHDCYAEYGDNCMCLDSDNGAVFSAGGDVQCTSTRCLDSKYLGTCVNGSYQIMDCSQSGQKCENNACTSGDNKCGNVAACDGNTANVCDAATGEVTKKDCAAENKICVEGNCVDQTNVCLNSECLENGKFKSCQDGAFVEEIDCSAAEKVCGINANGVLGCQDKCTADQNACTEDGSQLACDTETGILTKTECDEGQACNSASKTCEEICTVDAYVSTCSDDGKLSTCADGFVKTEACADGKVCGIDADGELGCQDKCTQNACADDGSLLACDTETGILTKTECDTGLTCSSATGTCENTCSAETFTNTCSEEGKLSTCADGLIKVEACADGKVCGIDADGKLGCQDKCTQDACADDGSQLACDTETGILTKTECDTGMACNPKINACAKTCSAEDSAFCADKLTLRECKDSFFTDTSCSTEESNKVCGETGEGDDKTYACIDAPSLIGTPCYCDETDPECTRTYTNAQLIAVMNDTVITKDGDGKYSFVKYGDLLGTLIKDGAIIDESLKIPNFTKITRGCEALKAAYKDSGLEVGCFRTSQYDIPVSFSDIFKANADGSSPFDMLVKFDESTDGKAKLKLAMEHFHKLLTDGIRLSAPEGYCTVGAMSFVGDPKGEIGSDIFKAEAFNADSDFAKAFKIGDTSSQNKVCPEGSTLVSFSVDKDSGKLFGTMNFKYDMCLKTCESSDECREGYQCGRFDCTGSYSSCPTENVCFDFVGQLKTPEEVAAIDGSFDCIKDADLNLNYTLADGNIGNHCYMLDFRAKVNNLISSLSTAISNAASAGSEMP